MDSYKKYKNKQDGNNVKEKNKEVWKHEGYNNNPRRDGTL